PAGAPEIRTGRRPMLPDDRPAATIAGAERGELLDLGCGTGIFLDEARRAGWRTSGYEVSDYGVAQAQARELDVAAMPIEGLQLSPARFDCVTLWDVIEHVRDPGATIAAAAHGLKPGGLLAVSTGDITSLCARLSGPKWHLFNLPEHLFFFSPDSLSRIIESRGCKVVRRVSEVNWIPVSYAVERLQKTLRMRVPLGRWLAARKWMLPATLFDVMGLYAVKRSSSL
ncbi:MAG: class I SAM-dependent methyltransferase, partial [Phycisphaerae bacterium]